jgi:branched-chain amino acid transport system permease protein
MDELQVIVAQGLTFGALYGLAALGFAILYHTTKVFHIAYGSLGVLGSFVAVALYSGDAPLKLILSVAAGVLAATVATIAVFQGPYRWLENKGGDRLAIFVSSLGIAYSVPPLLILVFSPEIRSYSIQGLVKVREVGGFPFTNLGFIVIAVSLLTLVALTWALAHTRWGYQVRALASNRELSQLVGARTGITLLGVYAVGGLCCALSATFLGMFTNITSAGGTNLALYAAVAVIAGGVQSYAGGFFFAVGLGFLQPIMSTLISSTWAPVGVFATVLLMILIKPAGIQFRLAKAATT